MCTRHRPGCELSPLLLAGELSLDGVHAHVQLGAILVEARGGSCLRQFAAGMLCAVPACVRGAGAAASRAHGDLGQFGRIKDSLDVCVPARPNLFGMVGRALRAVVSLPISPTPTVVCTLLRNFSGEAYVA